MYDFLLTFGREVEHIWRQKFSGATVLFILMRYAHFFDAIVVMLEIFPWAGQSVKVCTFYSPITCRTFTWGRSSRLAPQYTVSTRFSPSSLFSQQEVCGRFDSAGWYQHVYV